MRRTNMNDAVALEPLEARRLLSADLSPEGVLALTGTNQRDTISVEAGDIDGQVLVFGVPGVADGTAFDGVNSLRFILLRGNDIGEIVGTPLDTLGAPLGATMLGSGGNDILIGGDGDDVLKGGGGNDRLTGGAGDDLLKGNNNNDELFGGPGNDRLVGGNGRDELHGDDGDDRLLGNTNHDDLFGGPGNDRLVGGNGKDLLKGGDGNDELFGKNGKDLLFGDAGDDRLFGLNGKDILFGGDGDDLLKGGRAPDELHGGAGNDDLFGGSGPDILYGGSGNDQLTGDGARDIFRGPFFERQDFGPQDAFFTEDAGNGEAFAIISNELWEEIDRLDDLGLLNDTIWSGIDGVQQLLAECGGHKEAVINEFESLPGDDQDALNALIDPLFDAFEEDIGDNFQNLTGDRVFELFGDLQNVVTDEFGDLSDLLDEFVLCWESNSGAVDAAMAGFRELGDLGLLSDIFREAFFDDLLL